MGIWFPLAPWYPFYTNLSVILSYKFEDKKLHKQNKKIKCIFLKIMFFNVQTVKYCISVVLLFHHTVRIFVDFLISYLVLGSIPYSVLLIFLFFKFLMGCGF